MKLLIQLSFGLGTSQIYVWNIKHCTLLLCSVQNEIDKCFGAEFVIFIRCVLCTILGVKGRLLTFLKPLSGFEIWYEKSALKFMGNVSIWSLSIG
jgi:hypothetical protein